MLFTQKSIHAAAVLAIGAAALATGAVIPAAQAAEGAVQAQGRPPVEVVVVTVKPEAVQIDSVLTGRTSAYNVSEIRPQVNGILQKRLFTEGQEVKAGSTRSIPRSMTPSSRPPKRRSPRPARASRRPSPTRSAPPSL